MLTCPTHQPTAPRPTPADLYDALDAEHIIVRDCFPVGFFTNLGFKQREAFLSPFTETLLAGVLACSPNRLALEHQKTGTKSEAFALILEEKVRGGVFGFSDLLVRFATCIDSPTHTEYLLISPSAEDACMTILTGKRATRRSR